MVRIDGIMNLFQLFKIDPRMMKVCEDLDIWTLHDLCFLTEDEILEVDGIGRKTLNSFKQFLEKNDLSLNTNLTMPRELTNMPSGYFKIKPGTYGIMATRVMEQLDAWTLRELSKHTFSEILSCNGVGKTTAHLIESILEDHELKFKKEPPEPIKIYAGMPTRENKPFRFKSMKEAIKFSRIFIPMIYGKFGLSIYGKEKLIHKLLELSLEELNKLYGLVFTSLTQKDVSVVILRCLYGFTLRDIGMVLGITPERVRQVESKAFRKLSHPARRNHLFNL